MIFVLVMVIIASVLLMSGDDDMFDFVAFRCELGGELASGEGGNSIGGNSDKLNNSTGVHQLP